MMGIDVSSVKRYIKPKADSTLLNMKKVDLIEYVRTLEHNYNVAVSFNEQQARNIEDMMKNGVIPQQWISVEDDKPKRGGEYFVSYVFADCDMRFYGAAFWHDDLETNGYVTGPHFSNEGVDGMKVTHWMEIQKLPVMQEVPNGTDHV